MSAPIYPLARLQAVLDERRADGKVIVFTNGCFDLLHVGHTRYLQAARALGDCLVVALNSDASVKVLNKGTERPILPQAQRAEVLSALACVDFVTIFEEPDPLSVIRTLRPDILVKGGDWTPDRIVGRDVVEAYGGTVRTLPVVPEISTTHIIDRILQRRAAHEIPPPADHAMMPRSSEHS